VRTKVDGEIRAKASWTAQSVAANRAADTSQPPHRRLISDPYARHFVSDPLLRACIAHPLASRTFIGFTRRAFAGLHAYLVLRARYTDDAWIAAIEDGVDQLVVLGAGFDTISLRTTAHMPVTIFEVDAPATQEKKRIVFDQLRHSGSDKIIWVPCDFERDTLQQRLLANGFDPNRRCLVVWAGVTAYLTREAIEATVADLAALCSPGSQLVFDYIDADVVTGGLSRTAGARRAAWLAARRGEPFRTGFTSADIDNLLAANGFECSAHVSLIDLLQNYAPTQLRRLSGCDWQTIASAKRNAAAQRGRELPRS